MKQNHKGQANFQPDEKKNVPARRCQSLAEKHAFSLGSEAFEENFGQVDLFASSGLLYEEVGAAKDKLSNPGLPHLAKGRMHEVHGESSTVFALFAAAMMRGDILWIGTSQAVESLHPLSLRPWVDPSRLLLIKCLCRQECLWVAEKALRALESCVVIEIEQGLDLYESRRLQIAAAHSGALGLSLFRRKANICASETRWKCTAVNAKPYLWLWELEKARRILCRSWLVGWSEEKPFGATAVCLPAVSAA